MVYAGLAQKSSTSCLPDRSRVGPPREPSPEMSRSHSRWKVSSPIASQIPLTTHAAEAAPERAVVFELQLPPSEPVAELQTVSAQAESVDLTHVRSLLPAFVERFGHPAPA